MGINTHLIYPLFAMFVLSLVVMMIMFFDRVHAIKSGALKAGYFKTYNSQVPSERVTKSTRHFANLFEVPVLFYVVTLVGIVLPLDNSAFLALAWAYVACRGLHAIIHIGRNKLLYRMSAYGISWLILILMWILILIKLLSGAH